MVIAIIDYGTGNIRSIQSMLSRIGVTSILTSNVEEILAAERLILPGVGHFDFGMSQLRNSGLEQVLNYQALERKIPVLGICLGAQLLTRRSDEGTSAGLGWIAADTIRFEKSKLGPNLKVPHMGWSDTEFHPDCPLGRGFMQLPRFYYVHSFHLKCDDPKHEICHATYGYQFAGGIAQDNIMGVQFHPEKSHRFGMQVLKNFVDLVRT